MRVALIAAFRITGLAALAVAAGAGCRFNVPNKANIALRKESQALHEQIAQLEHERDAAVAQARASESSRAVSTLPVERLERLFTAAGLKFGKVNVGDDTDPATPGDEGFKVTLTPIDQYGDEFKSAGSFTIEVFDLAAEPARIGLWSIPTVEAQLKWLSTFVIDAYVFALPWQTPPAHGKLLVKATFVDELTGRTFEAKHDLTVTPPTIVTTTQATTQP